MFQIIYTLSLAVPLTLLTIETDTWFLKVIGAAWSLWLWSAAIIMGVDRARDQN
jgi:hypothetical protein